MTPPADPTDPHASAVADDDARTAALLVATLVEKMNGVVPAGVRYSVGTTA